MLDRDNDGGNRAVAASSSATRLKYIITTSPICDPSDYSDRKLPDPLIHVVHADKRHRLLRLRRHAARRVAWKTRRPQRSKLQRNARNSPAAAGPACPVPSTSAPACLLTHSMRRRRRCGDLRKGHGVKGEGEGRG